AVAGDADYLGGSDGSFELTAVGSLGSTRQAQGLYISPDGTHVIFTTGEAWCVAPGSACKKSQEIQLEPNAPPTGTAAIYDRQPDGPTRVVSLLPTNLPPAGGEDAEYQGASYDGTVVAFKIGGALYARINNEETKKVTEGAPTFAGLSADGRYLFYVVAGNINRFDTGSGISQSINSSGDAQVVNVSRDGSHVYFLSESQLDGSEGTSGEPNLYVWDGQSVKYIATVLPSDRESTSGEGPHQAGLARWTSWAVNPDRDMAGAGGRGPGADSSRTTPDGSVIAFESRASLTSFANAGHTEVYRYDDTSGDLLCVSCDPSVSPPTSDAHLQNLKIAHPPTIIHNLSADGTRIFFETSDPLVGRDVDGINDVYEWEKQSGSAIPSVNLISSGQSAAYPAPEAGDFPIPAPNVLMGATPEGNDVFFLSQDALTAGAGSGGASAIYDARIGGGFPHPASVAACTDLGVCQAGSASGAPVLTPPRSSRRTKGNVKPNHRRCRQGKRAKDHRHHRHRCGKRHHQKGRAR
ncbi:MAG TPA: hypothetical protein VFP17_10095, partial [Solirubrobacterales bacterium]|nr:hypothetical protein [Solirubrobacterales bacterium]